jgi:hypothetical protein
VPCQDNFSGNSLTAITEDWTRNHTDRRLRGLPGISSGLATTVGTLSLRYQVQSRAEKVEAVLPNPEKLEVLRSHENKVPSAKNVTQ